MKLPRKPPKSSVDEHEVMLKSIIQMLSNANAKSDLEFSKLPASKIIPSRDPVRSQSALPDWEAVRLTLGFTEPLLSGALRVGWLNPETKESVYI
jgi:hypothetical protein